MKRYWKRDRVKDLTQKELHKLIYFMYDFCVENLGVNNRKRTKLSCTLEKEKSGNYGWYDPQTNEVILSLYNCKTVGQICSTFIHEYTHSLQPCLTKYNKLYNEHGYTNHPFEIESKHNEKLYTNQLLREFRKKFLNP